VVCPPFIADTWELALIGKNLTDETTLASAGDMPFFTGSYFGTVMAPRAVAVELSYQF